MAACTDQYIHRNFQLDLKNAKIKDFSIHLVSKYVSGLPVVNHCMR